MAVACRQLLAHAIARIALFWERQSANLLLLTNPLPLPYLPASRQQVWIDRIALHFPRGSTEPPTPDQRDAALAALCGSSPSTG